ncbi:MAG: DUF3857 domain-containing protein [Chitinophagales bacterium]|nr:DUF3857 domain-containing protein [Chitinophagales bacterium]
MYTYNSLLNRTLMFLFLLTAFSSPVQAQRPPIKWGKVATSDLTMTVYEQDTSAAALVLTDYGVLKFDFTRGPAKHVMTRHTRIKIFDRKGYDHSDISIIYHNSDEIKNIKAQIHTPDGNSFDVKKGDIFEKPLNDNWNQVSFTFPQLTEGAIIEYKYTVDSRGIFTLPTWQFQTDIPILHSELRLSIPEWYDYIIINQGRKLNKSSIVERTDNLLVPTYNAPGSTGIIDVSNQMVSTQVFEHQYIMKDMPAFKAEAFMTTEDDYLAGMKFQLRSIKFPKQAAQPILSDWYIVAKDLSTSEYFGLQYTQRRRYKKILESLAPVMEQGDSNEEKFLLAFQQLNNEMQWNGYYSVGSHQNLNEHYEKKSANSGTLNLMLLALCNELGLEAYPLLLSTRDNGKMVEIYPILEQFNHTIAAVNINGNLLLFDLGNPNRPLGLPRKVSLNGKAWLPSPNNPQWVDINTPPSKSTEMFNYTFTADGEINFTLKGKYEGYSAVSLFEKFQNNASGSSIIKEWYKSFPGLDVKDVKLTGTSSDSEPLILEFSGDLTDAAQTIGDFIYVNPCMNPFFPENPLKLEERSYPVNIPYPIHQQSLVFITKPEGYQLEETPESIRINLPNGGGKFEYLINDVGTQLSVIMKMEINQLIYPPEEYKTIKNFFSLIIEKQNEQLVFSKKQ